MPIPPEERARAEGSLSQFCAGRVSDRARHQLEITYRIDGNNAYLVERRPRMRASQAWGELDVARFRYFVGHGEWVLYWSASNGRWHRYQDRRPVRRIKTLLNEVDAEPTGIFWG